MRFRNVEETSTHRQVVRDNYVCGTNAAGQCSAQRSLQSAGPERQTRFGVREKESSRKLVITGAKLTVPSCSELIVGIAARFADHKRSFWICRFGRVQIGSSRNRWDQKAPWARAELVPFEIQ